MTEGGIIDPDVIRCEPLQWPVTSRVGPGLQGAVINDTEIFGHDCMSGVVRYRGVTLPELHGRSFEEVAFLVIRGSWPDDDPSAWKEFREELLRGRQLPGELDDLVRAMPISVTPDRVLGVVLSAAEELEGEPLSQGLGFWLGRMGALVESLMSRGHDASSQEPFAGMAKSVLHRMSQGHGARPPGKEDVELLERCWNLNLDQDLDPATFSGMVVASCGTGPSGYLSAYVSALSGQYLSGSGERLMRLFQSFPGTEASREWVHRQVESGGRVPGFGHPLQVASDPRLALLRESLREIVVRQGRHDLYQIILAYEEAGNELLEPLGMFPNRLLSLAGIYTLLGALPRHCVVLESIPRSVGLLARVEEMSSHSRILRPRLDSSARSSLS